MAFLGKSHIFLLNVRIHTCKNEARPRTRVSKKTKKSETGKKKEADAKGRPKLTKQQENAGKSQTQKKAKQKAKNDDKHRGLCAN